MAPTILVVDDNKELVTLLTSLFEDAGYTVVGAFKGRSAIDTARESSPALALLDVLLPDMMGYAVGEAIRREYPSIPLIFMSGVFKGSRHAGEVATRFPQSKFIEKPFDAKKLLEEVKVLVPVEAGQGGDASSGAAAPGDFDVDLNLDIEDEQDPMELTGKVKVAQRGNAPTELSGAPLTAAPSPRGPVHGARPVMTASAITAAHSAPVPKSEGRTPRSGKLENNIPRLLSAFYLSSETGELYVQRGKVKKVVYFEKGSPVFALSNLAADRFGQFLVRVGKIRPEQLDDVAVVAAQTGRRTGDVLVDRGLLKDTERLYYVAQQVKSILYSLFAWEDGQFVLTFREKAQAEAIKLDVFPGNLILRGVKKLYKPERLARLVSDADRLIPSQQPSYNLHELEIEKWEAALLARIDGTKTVQELVALAGKPVHQVHAFLVGMMGVDVLVRMDA